MCLFGFAQATGTMPPESKLCSADPLYIPLSFSVSFVRPSPHLHSTPSLPFSLSLTPTKSPNQACSHPSTETQQPSHSSPSCQKSGARPLFPLTTSSHAASNPTMPVNRRSLAIVRTTLSGFLSPLRAKETNDTVHRRLHWNEKKENVPLR